MGPYLFFFSFVCYDKAAFFSWVSRRKAMLVPSLPGLLPDISDTETGSDNETILVKAREFGETNTNKN
jgi:hypothetical protein